MLPADSRRGRFGGPDGCVIPAAQMVDNAKMGKTEELIEDEVTLGPHLAGQYQEIP